MPRSAASGLLDTRSLGRKRRPRTQRWNDLLRSPAIDLKRNPASRDARAAVLPETGPVTVPRTTKARRRWRPSHRARTTRAPCTRDKRATRLPGRSAKDGPASLSGQSA